MRRCLVLTALMVATLVVATGAPAAATQAEPVPTPACLTIPKVDLNLALPKLPNLCDVKAALGTVAFNLGVSVGDVVTKVGSLAVQLKVGTEAVLALLLSLPKLVAQLLCL